MWFPSHTSFYAFLNQALFITFSALTSFNFAMTAIIGPSYLPIGWKPKNKKHESYLQKCSICPDTFKGPRSHHCRKCERCVVKMVNLNYFCLLYILKTLFICSTGSSLSIRCKCKSKISKFPSYFYYNKICEVYLIEAKIVSLLP